MGSLESVWLILFLGFLSLNMQTTQMKINNRRSTNFFIAHQIRVWNRTSERAVELAQEINNSTDETKKVKQ